MAIQELKETPGYVGIDTPDTVQTSQNTGDVPPPTTPRSGGLAPRVSSLVPGEALPVPASNLRPSEGGGDAFSGLAEALGSLGSILGGGDPSVPTSEAALPMPEAPVVQPPLQTTGQAQPQSQSLLQSMAPEAYASVQPIPPADAAARPVAPDQPNDRGYTSVLPGMASPSAQGRLPPPPAKSEVASLQQPQVSASRPQPSAPVTSTPTAVVPDSIRSVVEAYRSNPDSFKIDASSVLDRSPEVGKNWNFGTMASPNALVIHHTAGRGTSDGVIQTFKERNFPAHFIIERDGKIVQVLGINQKGQHTKNAQDGSGINNSNSWGVEIIAKDDNDLTPAQVQAAIQLTHYLEGFGLDRNRIVGHGAINSHKQRTEGKTVVDTLAQLKR